MWGKQSRVALRVPVVKRTIAFRQVYSASSTCIIFNFSTCSWKSLICSIKFITLSAAPTSGDAAWIPAAVIKCAGRNGIEAWEAFRTKSSPHTALNKAIWSVTWSCGKKGMFLAHSTALNKSLAANSQRLSMPRVAELNIGSPYLALDNGSARSNKDM